MVSLLPSARERKSVRGPPCDLALRSVSPAVSSHTLPASATAQGHQAGCCLTTSATTIPSAGTLLHGGPQASLPWVLQASLRSCQLCSEVFPHLPPQSCISPAFPDTTCHSALNVLHQHLLRKVHMPLIMLFAMAPPPVEAPRGQGVLTVLFIALYPVLTAMSGSSRHSISIE